MFGTTGEACCPLPLSAHVPSGAGFIHEKDNGLVFSLTVSDTVTVTDATILLGLSSVSIDLGVVHWVMQK
jgi:hypothetical protein